MIKFVVLISRAGRTCFARYLEHMDLRERTQLESDLIRKILARKTKECSFFDYQAMKIIYRQFASIFVIIGTDESENEIAVYEFIQHFIEILDSYFPKVSDFDLVANLDKVHIILEEMIANGNIAETRPSCVLAHLKLMDSQR